MIESYLRNIFNHQFFDYSFYGNTVFDYLMAVLFFLSLLALFYVLQKIILRKLRSLAKKTDTNLDDTFIKIVGSLRPPFYSFVAFYFASKSLTFPLIAEQVLDVVLVIWVVYQAVQAVSIFVDYVVKTRFDPEEKNAESAVTLIKNAIKFILWALGFLFILSNFGVNITSLIAGLGIGGVAIAFALQNILSDLFSSFAIFFDKPFREGDFIVVGDKMGTVQKIGIKTTRLRALQGEEIVFSNQELTSAQVQNYKKLERRRIVFEFGVSYETPTTKVKKIPKFVEDIITKQEEITFSRAHFKQFGDSALIFEVVYFVENSEYNVYMDANQNIMVSIKEKFEKEKINIAYPTRTLYVHTVK